MFDLVKKMQAVAATATLAVLMACGGGGDGSTAPTPPPTPSATAPTLSSQPASLAISAGQAATFTVTAAGTAPLNYQWQRDGKDIAGATSASYTLATPDVPDSGALLTVVVTNSAGSIKSNAAVLTVNALVIAPTLIVQPQSASTLDGSSVTFSVAASGSDPFTYRWQRNGVDIADAAAKSYTTPTLTLADTGAVYNVVVGNAAGSITSSGATLTVKPVAPSISTAPASVSVSVGQTASFSVVASGSAALGYQWRRNGVAISGATGSSYSTPVTTTADNGATFSVVVSNAAASVTSVNATLTVSSVAVAPSIPVAPLNVTVSVGQTATFSITAAGTAPLTYQWRRNAADIAGANSASYTTPGAALTDNGARYSVRVNNSAGTQTSADAVLTVNAATSGLIGRAWVTPQALETDDNNVLDSVAGIDDAGRALVVFLKSNGSRQVLYATRGTPNAAGVAPTWSTPVPIDLLGGVAVNNMTLNNKDFDLAVAPNGNAVARWFNTAPCTVTTYQTGGNCNFVYVARFLAASSTWEAPLLVGDQPSGGRILRINNRGDVAMLAPGWERSGTTSYKARPTVAWRASAANAFQQRIFNDAALGALDFDMDASGNMLLAAEANQNATTDLVAYRGSLSNGFGAQEILDTRGAAANLQRIAVGTGGQQIVVWNQNNGVSDTLFAAASTTAAGAFTITDLGVSRPSGMAALTISDEGNAVLYDLSRRTRMRWSGSGWLSSEALPSNVFSSFASSSACSVVRSGDFACIDTVSRGVWQTYDASRNMLVQAYDLSAPGPSYVLGFDTFGKSVGYSAPMLSLSGIAMVTLQNRFDVLPTSALPNGDARNVTNLWGVFLK